MTTQQSSNAFDGNVHALHNPLTASMPNHRLLATPRHDDRATCDAAIGDRSTSAVKPDACSTVGRLHELRHRSTATLLRGATAHGNANESIRSTRPAASGSESYRRRAVSSRVYAKLPRAPINASPVPHLTSLYHFAGPANMATAAIPAIAAAISSRTCCGISSRRRSSTR